MSDAVEYTTRERLALLTLNRPERLNAINGELTRGLAAAVARANRDDNVRVIILRGAGRAFCAGYDLQMAPQAETQAQERTGGWDPVADYRMMSENVRAFMSLWESRKPVIAQVHGWCVGGGSDMALCADLVIASEDAQIGTPYARVWGCYLTGMWIYRLSLARCKWHALTGESLSGKKAAEIELINQAVPFRALERTGDAFESTPDHSIGSRYCSRSVIRGSASPRWLTT